METNVNYTVVGAFVILLFAFIILGIIWLSSGFSVETYTTYKVNMKESVGGLDLDAGVEYNGVSVGSVSSIQINHDNPQLVELLLKIKKGTPITVGTRAKLDVRSLSGSAYILLLDKGTDMTPLKALAGQPYPVISTLPSLFLRLDTALTQLNDSFHQLSETVGAMLDKENLFAIKQTLINLHQLTKTLAIDSQQIHGILSTTSQSAQTFEMQTLPAAQQAITNLNTMTNNFSDIATEIKQNPSVLIRGSTPPMTGPGE